MVFSLCKDIFEDVLEFISGQEALFPEPKEESLEAKIDSIPPAINIVLPVVEEERKGAYLDHYIRRSTSYYPFSTPEQDQPEVKSSEDLYLTSLLKHWFTKSSAVVQQGMSLGISLILEGGDSSGKVFREFLNSLMYSARNLEQASGGVFRSLNIFSPDYTPYYSLSPAAYRFS